MDHFELQRIREIRLSERRFYQKVTDIYATSIDYDPKAQTTRRFFARVQNQLHWAIHGETAAEVIYHRADSEKEHMGLQTWKDSPNGKIQRFDVVVAKNYLTEDELSAMARIVNAYLDLAELRAEEQIPMTINCIRVILIVCCWKWRKKAMKNEKAEIIYHYCFLEGFLSIIQYSGIINR